MTTGREADRAVRRWQASEPNLAGPRSLNELVARALGTRQRRWHRGFVMGADRLMTIGELAEYLQVPRETIYRWRKRGGGPCGFRMGRHVRFRRSDVEAWLEARRDPAPLPMRSDLRFRQ